MREDICSWKNIAIQHNGIDWKGRLLKFVYPISVCSCTRVYRTSGKIHDPRILGIKMNILML